ncbi:MAG: alkaline phosphatase family protein [Anaerolineae bacterium]|nr:alkaline phosphatase family protein [Anaerolineae bacterium]
MMLNIYSMTCVAPTVSTLLDLPVPAQATGTAIAEMVAGVRDVDRVAILATDAFGEYAWGLWQGEMPYLRSLHAQHSLILRSVLPSITPVNFATMVAGNDLTGHGVRTYDDDFTCQTLFDVVRAAGGQSAGIGIAGYTGERLLARFADLAGVAQVRSDDAVADTVIEIVEGHRPVFLIAQLGVVDDVFHRYGPSSPEVVPMLRDTDARLKLEVIVPLITNFTVPMLRDTDARLKRLVETLKPAGYMVIILSDHGQHDIPDPQPGGLRGGHGSDSDQDCLVPCTWI